MSLMPKSLSMPRSSSEAPDASFLINDPSDKSPAFRPDSQGIREDSFHKISYGESGTLGLDPEYIPRFRKLLSMRESLNRKSMMIRDQGLFSRPVPEDTPSAAEPEDEALKAYPPLNSMKNLKGAVGRAGGHCPIRQSRTLGNLADPQPAVVLFSWMKHRNKTFNLGARGKENAMKPKPNEKSDAELRAMVDMIIDLQNAHGMRSLRVDWMKDMLKSAVKLQRTWRSYRKRIYWKSLMVGLLGEKDNKENAMMKRNEWGGWELSKENEKSEMPIDGEEEGTWSGDDWRYSDGSGEEYSDSGEDYSDSEEDTSSGDEGNDGSIVNIDTEEREKVRAERKEATVARKAARELRRQHRVARTSVRAQVRAARKAAELENEQMRMAEEGNRRIAAEREAARQAALLQAGITATIATAGKEGPHERGLQIHSPRATLSLQDQQALQVKPREIMMQSLLLEQANESKSSQRVQETSMQFQAELGFNGMAGEAEDYVQKILEERVKTAPLNDPVDPKHSPQKVELGLMRPVCPSKSLDIAGGTLATKYQPSHTRRTSVQEIWSSDFSSFPKENPLCVQRNMTRAEFGTHLNGGAKRVAQMSQGPEARISGWRRSSCTSLQPLMQARVPTRISTGGAEPSKLAEPAAASGKMQSRRMTADCQLPELRAATADVQRHQGRERPDKMKHSGSMPSLPSNLKPQPRLRGRNSFINTRPQPKQSFREMNDYRVHGSCPQFDIMINPPMTASPGQRSADKKL